VETDPLVAGKPERPLLEETVRRLGSRRPIFVGDRIDTDIAGAGNLDMDSLLVLTGAHGPVQLFSAIGIERPTYVGLDAGSLLADEPHARPAGEDRVAVGSIEAYLDHQQVRLSREPDDGDLVDAIWAATRLCWQCADAETPVDGFALADQLTTRVHAMLDS
jgi:hypothetical protein